MKLSTPLYRGKLIQRYKRFLSDIELEDGQIVTSHCPNSGSMKGCTIPGNPVLLSYNGNPKRKLHYTWELIKVNEGWVGINTNHPNKLVKEAIEMELIPQLRGSTGIRPEVKYGSSSRIDLLLEYPQQKCYVEVKNVTLVEDGIAKFPDAVTLRGQKHLKELREMVRQRHRGVIFFVIHREDARQFAPADEIDPEYGKILREVINAGVEILAYQTKINPPEVKITEPIPIFL